VETQDVIPVMRPSLPTADELLPYLRRIDEARWYSNHGPLVLELEAQLAAHFGVTPKQISLVANGTVALSAALLAAGVPAGSKCLVPSWTFVASASAIWAANLRPHFVDVSATTWMLEPEMVRRRTDLAEIGAVMVVSPFGAPVDIAAWDTFTAETGIPVIIDGAAAFDTVATVATMRPGRNPIMISLHATKVLGVGEGAVLLSTDEEVSNRIRRVCNFGVLSKPGGQILGYNGKLSEYHAAVGLAALQKWHARRKAVARLTERYTERVSQIGTLGLLPDYGNGWVSCYCNVALDQAASHVISRLAQLGVSTRRWWQSGVHVQRAYQAFTRDPLPVTDDLGARVFGLPFFHDLTDAQFDRVIDTLQIALSDKAASLT
jgi:dTDP-4-amino-4,6-dideoxygalactose transaminase